MDVSKIAFIIIAIIFGLAIWKCSGEKKEIKQEDENDDEDLYPSVDDDEIETSYYNKFLDDPNWRRKYAVDPYDHPDMFMDASGNFLEDFDEEREYKEHIGEEFIRLNKFPWDRQKIAASFNPPWNTKKPG